MASFRQLAVIGITFMTLVSCTTSPTGRKQLKLYSSSQLAGMGQQADIITLGHGFVRDGDKVEVVRADKNNASTNSLSSKAN